MSTRRATRLPSVPSLSWDDSRLLVESVVDYAIFMLDTEGRVATWNVGAKKIKGYTADEIVGEHFSKFYPAEDIAAGKPEQELEVATRLGRVEDEGWRIRKDGSRFWANVVITALRDVGGDLRGFGKVTRDLTERREAERLQRELVREQTARETAENAEERYRALSQRLEIVLEGVADGITVQDKSGLIVYANTAAAKICGFNSGPELMSTPPAEVVARFHMLDADGRPMRAENLPARRVLAGEPGGSAVLQVRERATQRTWWVLLRSSAVLDAAGKPELAVNIWHDVSVDRRQEIQAKYLADATMALGTSLVHGEMLSTLASVLVPGLADWCSIYLLEGEHLVDVASAHIDPEKRAATEKYRRQYPPDPAHAGGVWQVVRTGTPAILNDLTDEVLERSTRDPEAFAMLRSLGMRAALLAPIRVRNEMAGVIALISAGSGRRYDLNDASLVEELGRRAGAALENAQLYRAAQDAAKAAEHASRAKDEFLATVSHELRTPLNAIVGWASLLKDRVLDATIAKPIEVIHRNAQAQVKIIDDILDVSRVITGKLRLEPRPADLVVIARDAVEIVRPAAAAKGITIEFMPVIGFCLLVADPERLQQVVWNLLSNAVKFTDPGGTIRLSVAQDGSNVILSVADTGRGIEPSFLPHVFERFKQADSTTTRRVGGLGLGLALVRHIVELHGGHVAAHSGGLGKGAEFIVTLPIRAVIPRASEAPPSSVKAPAPVPLGVTLNGVRVLLIDDEADARDLVATVLLQAGASLETAGSAAEGYEAFTRLTPDVVVSDIGMPDEDGYSFMRRIRALSPAAGGTVPALALTAFAREEDRARALAAGFTSHLGKPVNPDALVSGVADLAAPKRAG